MARAFTELGEDMEDAAEKHLNRVVIMCSILEADRLAMIGSDTVRLRAFAIRSSGTWTSFSSGTAFGRSLRQSSN
jgi:hypothetical protein